jgi:hypothetical protein
MTETPPVGEALEGRREDQAARDARRRALRIRLLERMRTGRGIDFEALQEARHSGWTHG